MFYALFILLFIIFFMLYQHHREHHTISFTLVLVSYFFAIIGMMIYFSRDAYYYNVIKNYFYLPDPLWRKLFFLPISRFNVIRIMNVASLSIVLASVYFALSFHTPFTPRTIKLTKSESGFILCCSCLFTILQLTSVSIICYTLQLWDRSSSMMRKKLFISSHAAEITCLCSSA